MKNIKVTVLDLNGVKYIDELHERIRVTFDFGEGYGENWDAFWDSLSMDLVEELANIEIMGLTKLPAELKASGEKMIEIMQENKEYHEQANKRLPDNQYHFDYRIID